MCFKILIVFCIPNCAGTPKHIDYEAVKNDLVGLDGVKNAHSLQIWSLTLNRTALAVHLALGIGDVKCVHIFLFSTLNSCYPFKYASI